MATRLPRETRLTSGVDRQFKRSRAKRGKRLATSPGASAGGRDNGAPSTTEHGAKWSVAGRCSHPARLDW